MVVVKGEWSRRVALHEACMRVQVHTGTGMPIKLFLYESQGEGGGGGESKQILREYGFKKKNFENYGRPLSTRQWAKCHGFLSLLCLDRAATVQTYHPTKTLSIFSFLSPVFGECPPNHAVD